MPRVSRQHSRMGMDLQTEVTEAKAMPTPTIR